MDLHAVMSHCRYGQICVQYYQLVIMYVFVCIDVRWWLWGDLHAVMSHCRYGQICVQYYQLVIM